MSKLQIKRNKRLYAMWVMGFPITQLATRFKISYKRVSQIILSMKPSIADRLKHHENRLISFPVRKRINTKKDVQEKEPVS